MRIKGFLEERVDLCLTTKCKMNFVLMKEMERIF